MYLGILITYKTIFTLTGMCWNVAQQENHVFLGYESGHLVIFDKRNFAQQVSFILYIVY